jgi:hypothetical protein
MRLFLSVIALYTVSVISAQSIKQEKMQALSFMVGEWVGTSSMFQQGELTEQVPAFERISYDLDSSIIVIELNSSLLQLHTIIRYDEEKATYEYYAFSENRAGMLPASLLDGRLVVQANKTKRYIFEPHGEHGFREYGEQLIDGEWQIYFEDVFIDTR